jgi:hypothetical protein
MRCVHRRRFRTNATGYNWPRFGPPGICRASITISSLGAKPSPGRELPLHLHHLSARPVMTPEAIMRNRPSPTFLASATTKLHHCFAAWYGCGSRSLVGWRQTGSGREERLEKAAVAVVDANICPWWTRTSSSRKTRTVQRATFEAVTTRPLTIQAGGTPGFAADGEVCASRLALTIITRVRIEGAACMPPGWENPPRERGIHEAGNKIIRLLNRVERDTPRLRSGQACATPLTSSSFTRRGLALSTIFCSRYSDRSPGMASIASMRRLTMKRNPVRG